MQWHEGPRHTHTYICNKKPLREALNLQPLSVTSPSGPATRKGAPSWSRLSRHRWPGKLLIGQHKHRQGRALSQEGAITNVRGHWRQHFRQQNVAGPAPVREALRTSSSTAAVLTTLSRTPAGLPSVPPRGSHPDGIRESLPFSPGVQTLSSPAPRAVHLRVTPPGLPEVPAEERPAAPARPYLRGCGPRPGSVGGQPPGGWQHHEQQQPEPQQRRKGALHLELHRRGAAGGEGVAARAGAGPRGGAGPLTSMGGANFVSFLSAFGIRKGFLFQTSAILYEAFTFGVCFCFLFQNNSQGWT